jgi:tRNA (guanosine-2'-O-)-methyltransferase
MSTQVYTPLEQFLVPERRERIDAVARNRTRDIVIVLERVMNAHNISAVLRSADAFGIQEIIYIGDELNLAQGISLGSEQWLTIRKFSSTADALSALTEYQLVVLRSPLSESGVSQEKINVPVFQLPFQKKLALIFGNEHKGVSEEIFERADLLAHIPMLGFVESFNISVAAAITLFCSTFSGAEAKRQVNSVGDEEIRELKDTWLKKTLRNGEKLDEELKRRDTK